MKEMRLWKPEVPNGTIGGPVSAATPNGGYVSLRSGSSCTLHAGNGSNGGSAFLRCCVYRLANVNIRRWILALVLITVLSIVCYTRLIDAPFST